MSIPVVFLDANVLYSRTLCDWIFMLRLEVPGMFRLFSSADVLEEVAYHFRKRRPMAGGDVIQAKRDHIRKFLDDVVIDFPGDVPFEGDDVHDAHVHAAAIEAGASYLVTNDRGFAAIDSDSTPYETHTVDTFLCVVAENSPFAVQEVITRQLAHRSRRTDSKPLTDSLRDAGCPVFADRVALALQAMSGGYSVVTALAPVRPN